MLGKRYRNDGVAIKHLSATQQEVRNQIANKIKAGHYQFEQIHICPCCDSDNFELLSEKDRYGLYHRVVICTCCGLVQNNPRPTLETLNQFYTTDYRPLYSDTHYATELQFQGAYKNGERIITYLTEVGFWKQLPDPPYVVEIGCGSGGILKYFQDRGCKVLGVDLNTDYLKYGKGRYNLNVIEGNVDTIIKLDTQPISIIIYSHVLEHVPDIAQELEKIEELMTPDTLLYIEVPGVKHLQTYGYNFLRSLQNAHVYYFTLTTLSNLMNRHGLALSLGTEFVRAIYHRRADKSEILPTSYTNDYLSTMRYLRWIEALRWWKLTQAKYDAWYTLLGILRKLRFFDFVREFYQHTLKLK